MDSPVVRVIMATLFTMVLVVVTFIVAGLTIGNAIGLPGMVMVLVASGVIWWVVGHKLFRVGQR